MGLKAVNLTKLSFTGEVASKIAAGYYSFIYLVCFEDDDFDR